MNKHDRIIASKTLMAAAADISDNEIVDTLVT